MTQTETTQVEDTSDIIDELEERDTKLSGYIHAVQILIADAGGLMSSLDDDEYASVDASVEIARAIDALLDVNRILSEHRDDVQAELEEAEEAGAAADAAAE